jgi:hypothetical protein
MIKKTLGLTLLVCLSGSALASTNIDISVSSAEKKFCFYENNAYSPGSKIKPIKKVLTCMTGNSSKGSGIAYWK